MTDICDAIFQSLQLGSSGSIMNISGVEKISINEAIRTIEDILGKKSEAIYEQSRRGDQRETLGASLEAWKTIDYFPRINFRAGIENQIRAILDER